MQVLLFRSEHSWADYDKCSAEQCFRPSEAIAELIQDGSRVIGLVGKAHRQLGRQVLEPAASFAHQQLRKVSFFGIDVVVGRHANTHAQLSGEVHTQLFGRRSQVHDWFVWWRAIVEIHSVHLVIEGA